MEKYSKLINKSDKSIFLTFSFIIICCFMNDGLVLYFAVGMILCMLAFYKRMLCNYVYLRELKFFTWLILIWGYIYSSTIFHPNLYFGWKSILVYLLPALSVMIYYSDKMNKTEVFNIFVSSIKNSFIFILLYIIINELPNIITGGLRIGDSASGNVNTLAINLSIYSVVFYYLICFENKKNMWKYFILCIIFILLTGSKKGLLSIILIVFFIKLCKYKTKIYRFIPYIAFVVFLFYIIQSNSYLYSILGHRIEDFIASIIEDREYGSTAERLGMYRIGWMLFLNNPFFGNGYGYFASNTSYGTYSHNNYIEMLVSFGIFGTLLYYSMFIDLLLKYSKKIKIDNRAIMFVGIIALQIILDFASINFYNSALMYITLYFSYKYIKT